MRTSRGSHSESANRRSASERAGSALLAVLVVVAMLSLAAYTYSELMFSEYEASLRSARMAEARQLADSGIEWAAIIIAKRGTDDEENLYHNPELFHQVMVMSESGERAAGYFSIVAAVENGGTPPYRFGLMNESAKLNVNSLADSTLEEQEVANFLLGLPNMTEEIADAILDYIDADEETRAFGAESDYYQTLLPPYDCKNAPLETLDELLRVAGVTAELLYGEDANRNGMLDPNENDGAATAPMDNADGVLDLGWSAFLTVNARESNLRSDGSEKINLNSNVLTDLYDQLADEFDEEIAQFIVAYRLFGDATREDESPTGVSGAQTSELTQPEQQFLQDLSQSIARAVVSGNADGSVTRGGMDLSGGGSYRINSLYDLVDAEVTGTIDGATQTLQSPWSSDAGDLMNSMPDLQDRLGITSDTWIEGRVDINQARYEVLIGLPGMTEEIAEGILSSKLISDDGQPLLDSLQTHATNAWLLIEGIVDLDTMRQLDPYVTTKGDVFQAQVLGYFGKWGTVSRVNVFIDGSQNPPKVMSYSDYTDLGSGYPLHEWQSDFGGP